MSPAAARGQHTMEIRELIERWARAVHAGDLDTVLADHADDIVMFDVPPPYEGVRGIDAYRETWQPPAAHARPAQAGRRLGRRPRAPFVPAQGLIARNRNARNSTM
jgi:hypothetical protein